jgi:hypothetical protein
VVAQLTQIKVMDQNMRGTTFQNVRKSRWATGCEIGRGFPPVFLKKPKKQCIDGKLEYNYRMCSGTGGDGFTCHLTCSASVSEKYSNRMLFSLPLQGGSKKGLHFFRGRFLRTGMTCDNIFNIFVNYNILVVYGENGVEKELKI